MSHCEVEAWKIEPCDKLRAQVPIGIIVHLRQSPGELVLITRRGKRVGKQAIIDRE
jgi:hypothetical protein